MSIIILIGWQREWTRQQRQIERVRSGAKKAAPPSCWEKWVWHRRQKRRCNDHNSSYNLHILYRRRDSLAQVILWNKTHLCSCFIQQEDELPSPEHAPELVEAKTEPADSKPAKQTPSAHAQSPTASSKSTQKRKSGGGDANTSNGATSKKIKIEPVWILFILC